MIFPAFFWLDITTNLVDRSRPISGSWLMASFGIGCVKSSVCTTRELIN